MKLGFEESQLSYSSGTQKARAWTEAWVSAQAYCPHCGNARMAQFPNNSPLADFLCTSCNEEFELKSQKGKFGATVTNGAYKTKCERLAADNNPNLLLMNYDVKSLSVAICSLCQSISSSKTSLRNESRLPPQHGEPAGSGRKSDWTACLSPARFISSRAESFGRRTLFLRNGKRRSSSGTSHWKHAAGCSM